MFAWSGYIPKQLNAYEARPRGGYELWAGKSAGAYLLADNIDDVLVSENLRRLRSLSK